MSVSILMQIKQSQSRSEKEGCDQIFLQGDKLACKGLAEGDQESFVAYTAMKIHKNNSYISFTNNSHTKYVYELMAYLRSIGMKICLWRMH